MPDRKRTLDAARVRHAATYGKVDHAVFAEIVHTLNELDGTLHAMTDWDRIVRAREDSTWQLVPDERNLITKLIRTRYATVNFQDPQSVPDADRERLGPHVFPISVTERGRTALAYLSIP